MKNMFIPQLLIFTLGLISFEAKTSEGLTPEERKDKKERLERELREIDRKKEELQRLKKEAEKKRLKEELLKEEEIRKLTKLEAEKKRLERKKLLEETQKDIEKIQQQLKKRKLAQQETERLRKEQEEKNRLEKERVKEELLKIKKPMPLNRPYETMVDYAVHILHKQEPDGSKALQEELFTSLRACTGVGLKEEKVSHGQYVIIATMLVVRSLFSHVDPNSGKPDWDTLIPHINTYIDIYTSDDQSFVVFIPKNYKEGEFKKDGTKIKFSNKEEQLQYIGFNPQALKPLNINDIKPREELYQSRVLKTQEIDVKKLESIFIQSTKIARCIYLVGHGEVKKRIAGMNKATYLALLNLLEKLNTRFLFIASCYSGGINTVIMNVFLKEDFRDTMDLNQEKSFDILNIHFPIVVEATSDAAATIGKISLDDEKLFFLNNFFTTLHAFLRSPTWDFSIKKRDWRLKMGKNLTLERLTELLKIVIDKQTPEQKKEIQDLNQQAKLWEMLNSLEEKTKRSPDEDKKLKELTIALEEFEHPRLHGPVVFMQDVLKQIYSARHQSIFSKLNLPSIFIPDCKEIPGGIFFEAIKVDNMEVITNKNLTTIIAIADRERKRIIGEKGEIKEHRLTEKEKLKQTKYVLVYPIDMSKTTFTIACKEPPTFISKIGGNAYHIIGTFDDKTHDFDTIITSFIYPQDTSPDRLGIGSSSKAWLIGELRTKTKVLDGVVLYKPTEIKDSDKTFSGFTMFSYKNAYYIYTMNFFKTNDYPWIKFSYSPTQEISSAYYNAYLKAILKDCSPDHLALEKFTASRETPETIKAAADNFLTSAVPSVATITLDDIKEAQKILSISDSLAIARQATFEMFSEIGKQSKQLLDQAVSSMQLKDNTTLLHLAIQTGVDKDILKNLITDKSIVMQNNNGLPPLHYAIYKNANKDIIKLLINDKSIAEKNEDGLPPLHYAISQKANQDIIKLLINVHSLKAQDKDGLTPLHYAIKWNTDKDIIKLLINDDSLKAQDKSGFTPLRIAIRQQANPDIIKLLINDDSLKAQDKYGLTPLHLAIDEDANKDIIKLLINADSLKAQDKDGLTPLHIAIERKADKDIIESLITNETINIKNKDGLTPLQFAIENGAKNDIIDLLKMYGGK